MSLQEFFNWVLEQAGYLIVVALVIIMIISAIQRRWLQAVGSVLGIALVGVFIWVPDTLQNISEWMSGLLNF